PPGDTTGWGFRPAARSVGSCADATCQAIAATKPSRQYSYQWYANGRLQEVDAPLTGAVPLPGPGGGPRAIGQPPGALLGDSTVVLQRLSYDQFGNVQMVGNQENQCVAGFTYDTLFSQLPVTKTIYPSGCGNPGLTTTFVYDRRFGK